MGLLSYIIPENIIKTDDYENIRKFILSNFSIILILDCGKKFEKVIGEMISLLISRRNAVYRRNVSRRSDVLERLYSMSFFLPPLYNYKAV
jgi:hypothetical protein